LNHDIHFETHQADLHHLSESQSLPLVRELQPAPDVTACLRRWADQPYPLLLDSVSRLKHLGRYSFLTADPFASIVCHRDASAALQTIRSRLQEFQTSTYPDLPPFQGGLAGVFAYDLNRAFESIPGPAIDEFQFPTVACGLYDVVIAWDHQQDRAWIVSQGWPEMDPDRRHKRASERLEWAAAITLQPATSTERQPTKHRIEPIARQYPVERFQTVTSNFSCAGYLDAVQQSIDYINQGDIFQVNLSQRLLMRFVDDPLTAYLQLRATNPAPFAGYFDLGTHCLLSASPERFVQVRDRQVETRPIKGTRPRTSFPEVDLHAAAELLRSEKDRAENVMIVDLLRNDLSRICQANSINVTQLCQIENYQYVQHLVSAVEGRLLDRIDAVDLLAATFPGGSITGAPKIRAMEIIAELEPTARGAYCGCLGYLGFDGAIDLNILIRTMTISGGYCQFPVGGGIVADSQPVKEYAETWDKAIGMLSALRSFAGG
jgi:para-aminobenzoate synthetase component 1